MYVVRKQYRCQHFSRVLYFGQLSAARVCITRICIYIPGIIYDWVLRARCCVLSSDVLGLSFLSFFVVFCYTRNFISTRFAW